MITSLLYPLYQCLDEVYLNCNVILGGIDQRKIYTLARDLLQKIGYEKRVHLMNLIISSLSKTGGEKVKMSASSATGKISLIATNKQIRKTISKIYCQEGNISDNTGLLLLKELLFPILDDLEQKFKINRPEKYGGQIEYDDYKSVETDFSNLKLPAPDLKIGISDLLIQLITPIRLRFQSSEMQAYN